MDIENKKKIEVEELAGVMGKRPEGVKDTDSMVTETISIPVDEWKKMQQRVEMLTEVSDKGRLAHWQSKHQDVTVRQARVNVIKGNPIIGWQTIIDEGVRRDPRTGGWIENQIIEVFYIDGSKEQMKYGTFVNLTTKVECDIIKRNKVIDANGESEIITLDFDGKQVDIDSRFVN